MGESVTRSHVSVKGLGVKLGQQIIEGIFMEMKKGEFASIVGKSGTGKTTFLNALSGLVKSEGQIRKPEKMALVFQNYSLFPWMSVGENIGFGLEKHDGKKIGEIISKIGLEGKENHYPYQLSGGQQQRVAIARALASEPELLLLDEPFASLDSYTRLKMQEWLNEMTNENNATTILVTHDVDEAILLSDRVLVLKDKTVKGVFTVPFTRPRESGISEYKISAPN